MRVYRSPEVAFDFYSTGILVYFWAQRSQRVTTCGASSPRPEERAESW